MKVALFKNIRYPDFSPLPSDAGLDGSADYTRVSEYVDVEFPPLSDEDEVRRQINELNHKAQTLREKFEGEINGIEARRSELQRALPPE